VVMWLFGTQFQERNRWLITLNHVHGFVWPMTLVGKLRLDMQGFSSGVTTVHLLSLPSASFSTNHGFFCSCGIYGREIITHRR
jgi:hypothetical protein